MSFDPIGPLRRKYNSSGVSLGIVDNDGNTVIPDFAGGTWEMSANLAQTRAIGEAPAGTTIAWQLIVSASGDGGGTTDIRNRLSNYTFSGGNSASQLYGEQVQMEVNTSGGTVGTAFAKTAYLRLGRSGGTSGTLSSGAVYEGHIAHEGSTGALTSAAVFLASSIDLADGTGQVGSVYGMQINNLGHASRITTYAAGIRCNDFTGGAAITACLVSQITAGTNKWNLYIDGTANNCISAPTKFGAATAPVAHVDIAASTTAKAHIRLATGVAPSAPAAGDLWFEGTSLKIRDSGGTTRTINWT